MRILVVGDIHGAHKALKQVLKRSKFDYKQDTLICLGDVADGWSEVPKCFDELLKIKNLVYIMGNHDQWLLDWFTTGVTEYMWLSQGGLATKEAYQLRSRNDEGKSIRKHSKFLSTKAHYHYEFEDKLFVHGGFNWYNPITHTSTHDRMWDRHLFETAVMWEKENQNKGTDHKVKRYDEVFIGHSSTSYYFKDLKPVKVSNVWNLDQGAGWEGKLTIMDIYTKEYWQSDIVSTLYPDEKGRR